MILHCTNAAREGVTAWYGRCRQSFSDILATSVLAESFKEMFASAKAMNKRIRRHYRVFLIFSLNILYIVTAVKVTHR